MGVMEKSMSGNNNYKANICRYWIPFQVALSFILLFLTIQLNAQTDQVFSGRVVDGFTKESLVGANIYLKKDMKSGNCERF